MIREAPYLALLFAGHMIWNVSTGDGDHRFTGDPDPSSPDYNVLAQPVVLTLMQQYVAKGTLLSDDLIQLTPSVTATVTAVVNQPSPLVVGHYLITGKISDPMATIHLCWKVWGARITLSDPDVVVATMLEDGTFSAVMGIVHPGTPAVMFYSINSGRLQMAWAGFPQRFIRTL